MTALLSPSAKQQFFDDAGNPAAGYLLYTYAANTTTPLATYTNRAGTVANTNPIVLDARGEATVYLTPGTVYDYVLKTASDATVWTREDVTADAGDADTVAFTSPLAGAVRRSLYDRAQDWVSIFDFCTAEQIADVRTRARTLDVSDAFTAAIATGKKIYCPAGDYLVGETVGTATREVGYHLEGDGPKFTQFVINGSGTAGAAAGFVASGTTTTIKGIMFTPIGAKPTRALHIDNTSIYSFGDVIEDCWFYAASAAVNFLTGLEMTNNWYWAVRNCVFQNGAINSDFNGNLIALRSTVAGVIDSCHMLSGNTALFLTPDVVAGHMNEGLSVTNSNIAAVTSVMFAPPNTVAHPSTHYSVTVSHNVIDPIQSFVVDGLINSLRVVNNHIGITNNAGMLVDLDAGSFSTVIGQNRVVAPSTSTATGITLREQGAIIDGNAIEGFNIIADLTSASRPVVTNNVFSLSVGVPVIMGAGGVYESNQEISCGAAPTLGDAARCGIYTPTLTNTLNIAASTAYECQWMRVKQGAYDVVTVSGKVDVDPTAATTDTVLRISLPVASNFSTVQQLGGAATLDDGAENLSARISANAANDVAQMAWRTATNIANQAWFFTFTYRVL